MRKSSSVMMLSSGSLSGWSSVDAGVDFDVGGVYGRGALRMEGMGRCRLEEVENCEVLEVLRA